MAQVLIGMLNLHGRLVFAAHNRIPLLTGPAICGTVRGHDKFPCMGIQRELG
jgi:hypothetical protein